MPKKINREDWTFKPGDVFTQRVFSALDWIARQELKDRTRAANVDASDLTEARLRYYLGFEDEKDRSRFANLKTARSSADIGVLNSLVERGKVSARWLLTGDGEIGDARDALRLLERRVSDVVGDLADEAAQSTSGAINENNWVFRVLQLAPVYYSAMRSHAFAEPLQKRVTSDVRYMSNQTMFGDDMASYRDPETHGMLINSSKATKGRSSESTLRIEDVVTAFKEYGIDLDKLRAQQNREAPQRKKAAKKRTRASSAKKTKKKTSKRR